MADFNFHLNRQGVRGPQGPQGEQGFSPDITVETDTLSEYILRITNEGGYFLTTNLREHKEDRGGTYIRYDRDTGVMYAGDPDVASIDNAGVIRIAKDEDFAGDAEDAAVTPKQSKDYIGEQITALDTSLTNKINEVDIKLSDDITELDSTVVKLDGRQTITGRKTFSDRIITENIVDTQSRNLIRKTDTTVVLGSTNLITSLNGSNSVLLHKNTKNMGEILAQSSVTAGDNITIEYTDDGIKITGTGGDITASGDNEFTGTNTFDKTVTVKNTLTVYGSSVSSTPDLVINKQSASAGILDFGAVGLTIQGTNKTGTVTYVAFFGNTGIQVNQDIRTSFNIDEDKPYYLHQNSIEAGDNITLEKTEKGIKISGQAGGGIGDVTLAGDNNFTGSNTFSKDVTVNAKVKANNLEVLGIGNIKSLQAEDAYITGTISSLGEINAVSINAAGIKNNQTDKYYLTQSTITAGDNITIEEVDEGVKVSATGGISQEVFDALVARVAALEALIDGGNASDIYPADPQKIDANPVVDSPINTGETSGSVDITVEDN